MVGWDAMLFEGTTVADLGMVGAAQGDVLVAGADPFTFAVLTKGPDGKFLKAGASTVTWEDANVAKLSDIGDVEGYAGNGGKVLAVNAGGSDVEWVTGGGSVAKLSDIGDVEGYAGNGGKVLAVNAGGSDVEWVTGGVGDFKADGTVTMTAALRLRANAGESGMGTTDGSIFFDTTANEVKVYIA